MSSVNSDLAAWSIAYIRDKVAEYGMATSIRTSYDDTGLIIRAYYLEYECVLGDVRHGALARYMPYELVEMYHDETLDMIAHRFAHWVRRKIEEMGNG